MMAKNYIRLEKKFNRRYYAYVDTKDCLADHLFFEAGIKVNIKTILAKEEEFITIVVCTIKEKDEKVFLECLNKLSNIIELYSWRDDYKNICKFLETEFN